MLRKMSDSKPLKPLSVQTKEKPVQSFARQTKFGLVEASVASANGVKKSLSLVEYTKAWITPPPSETGGTHD
jgi:hypothetical protein